MTEARMQNICWMGMSLQVPGSWEMVRHATSSRQGSLMMVDRRHQRLQLTWQQIQREPDLEQMIEDYRNKDLEEHRGVKHKRVVGVGGWVALRRSRADHHLTRAVRFEKSCSRLVELVLPWPGVGGADGEVELDVLQGYRLEGPDGQSERWCAFGLEVQTPQGWSLHSAEIEPGSANMRFIKGRSEALIRRLGAVDAWFKGRLETFVQQQVEDASKTPRLRTYRNHPACELTTEEPCTRWQRWTGKARRRMDLAWLCPTDHAVYHLMTLSPMKLERAAEPGDFAVGCCQAGEALGQQG